MNKNITNSSKTFKKYVTYMKARTSNDGWHIICIFLGCLIFSGLSIFIALISKFLLDNLFNMDIKDMILLVLISISAFALGAILGFLISYLQKYYIDKFKMKIQLKFYDDMQKSEYLFISNISPSDVYYHMFTDIGNMVDFYFNLIIALPIKFITFLIAISIMFVWSYPITLTILLLIMIQFLITVLFRKPIKKKSQILLEKEQELLAQINSDVINLDTSRSLGLEQYNLNKINLFFQRSRLAKLKYEKVSLLFGTSLNFSSQIMNVILLLIGVYLISLNHITLGMMMGISLLSSYIYDPFGEILNSVIQFQTVGVSFNRFLGFAKQIDHNREIGKEHFVNGDIEISNIDFAYGNVQIFNDFSLKIKEGRISCIKGCNGVGKTTLMRLISRFMIPQSGDISINNININSINYDEYRKNLIVLTSEPVLFNLSLYENICIGENKFSKNDVYRVIDECGLMNVVKKLPNGINTSLGINNIQLSQGEKQKIALARVFIRKPKIMILDEPFTFIDNDSKQELIKIIKKINVKYQTTIIIISHDNIFDNISSEIMSI